MTADPASVEVVGPESAVKRVTEVLTEPVSVSRARATASAERGDLGVLDPSLRLKNARSAAVTVADRAGAARAHSSRSRPIHLSRA